MGLDQLLKLRLFFIVVQLHAQSLNYPEVVLQGVLQGHRHELAVEIIDEVALVCPLETEDEVVKDVLSAVSDGILILSDLVVQQVLNKLLCLYVSLLRVSNQLLYSAMEICTVQGAAQVAEPSYEVVTLLIFLALDVNEIEETFPDVLNVPILIRKGAQKREDLGFSLLFDEVIERLKRHDLDL